MAKLVGMKNHYDHGGDRPEAIETGKIEWFQLVDIKIGQWIVCQPIPGNLLRIALSLFNCI